MLRTEVHDDLAILRYMIYEYEGRFAEPDGPQLDCEDTCADAHRDEASGERVVSSES